MRNSVFTVGQLILLSALGIDINDPVAVERSNVKFRDGNMYLRANITNKGGIVELIDSNTKKVDGVSSFNGTQLESGTFMALEKIRLGYGTSATAGGETDVFKIKYSPSYSAAPAVLANADLVISQGGKDIVTVPVQRLLCGTDSRRPAGTEDAFELNAVRLLEENTELKIALRFPNGVSIGNAANHFLELHLIGAATNRRA